MKILFTNAQSLTGKISELEAVASDNQPDLILICESWCNSNISNVNLCIEGYELQQDLRCDRTDTANGIGGGLVVYSRNGLEVLSCDIVSDYNQYCKFMLKSESETCFFYLIYRPPSSREENFNKLCDLLKGAEKNSIFVGDFNLPGIDWTTGRGEGRDGRLVQIIQDLLMEQLVDFPTHLRGNCLDLVITNNPDLVKEVTDVGRLGKSDHVMLEVIIATGEGRKREEVAVKNWKRADWCKIKEGLRNTTWPTTMDQHSAEEAWQVLRNKLDLLVEEHVPTSTFRPRKSDWMTGDILRGIRRKRRQWRKAKTGNSMDKAEYETTAKQVKNMIRNAKRNLEKKLATERYYNSKPFYNYIKKKSTYRSAIGPLTNSQGDTVSEEKEMAEELNKYFTSVFTREDLHSIPEPAPMRIRTKLRGTWISTEKVRKKIKDLKPHGAAGPDGIRPKLLQECVEELAPVLAMIGRKSMETGMVPAEWKKANVIPIFKKGKKASPGNYRPVSLTSVCCKIVESIIKDDLLRHLKSNKLINTSQHGFTKNRSCTTNLLEFLELITKEVDNGKSVDVVYLDFAKAFDKVPTARLLKKLKAHGVEGKVAAWVKAWLTDRTQRVSVRGKFSSWQQVLSGVPQGSVLGPVLFTIFINDLDSSVTRQQIIKKFADDTKVAQVLNGPEDAEELQRTLDSLCEWARTWGMAFNVEKCHVMHLGLNNQRQEYRMNGSRLSTTECERDIGVLVSNKLKPSLQCKKAAQTASTVLAQITRAFHYRDKHVFKNLYQQYVRPHLEFAVAAWSPWLQADIDSLEAVQRRAVKAISGLKSNTYEERLKELGLPSLHARRQEIDMVQTYKLVNNMDTDNSELWFERADSRRVTRNNAVRHNLVPKRDQHEFRRNFFSSRVVEHWNRLPEEVRDAPTVSSFKRLYRRHAEGTVAPAAHTD